LILACAAAAALTPTTVGARAPTVLRLSSHDSGRTIHLRRGTTINVMLGTGGLAWAPPASANSRVVTRVGFGRIGPLGARATLLARRAGRTTLVASGSCPPPAPGSVSCHIVALWTVSLVVS